MILQTMTPKLPPNLDHGLLKNSTFLVKQPIIISSRRKSHGSPSFITCSWTSKAHNYGTVDYERKGPLKWHAIYDKIIHLKDPSMGAASVLNESEKGRYSIAKWELHRLVKHLRKFRNYQSALEVMEWINNRSEIYRITTSDTAIQLDLVAKLHGVSKAEIFFHNVPDSLKDKRLYTSLLNSYVHAEMKEKAESLMDKIRNRGYARYALPFNVMMTLYKKLEDYEKIESLIAEMKERNVPLDLYTYNIRLGSLGSQGSLEKMEQVLKEMEKMPNINQSWATFATVAAVYIKSGQVEKAEESLRRIESKITNQDRLPYHHLISLYGNAGKKEDVHRVWGVYKSSFVKITNMGYHSVISALIRANDVQGAENIYDEWLSVKTRFEPRLTNLLLASYVQKGMSDKAEAFYRKMIEDGGTPNSMTWEFLAENHIENRRMSEALSCLHKAATAIGSLGWKPRPNNVSMILKISNQQGDGDTSIKDALIDVLRKVGCLDDRKYMSSLLGAGTNISLQEIFVLE